MKTFVLIAAAACGLCLSAAALKAADDKAKTYTGVLIDSKCGSGKDEAGAAGHPKGCVLKCAADHDLELISGDKHLTLDDKSKDLAKAYLAKADSTKVTITGSVDGDKLHVTDIKAAGGEAGKGKDSGDEHK